VRLARETLQRRPGAFLKAGSWATSLASPKSSASARLPAGPACCTGRYALPAASLPR